MAEVVITMTIFIRVPVHITVSVATITAMPDFITALAIIAAPLAIVGMAIHHQFIQDQTEAGATTEIEIATTGTIDMTAMIETTGTAIPTPIMK